MRVGVDEEGGRVWSAAYVDWGGYSRLYLHKIEETSNVHVH